MRVVITWDLVMQALPHVGTGLGAVTFAIIFLIRSQFKGIKTEVKRQGLLLNRVVAMHCKKYPKDAYQLLGETEPNIQVEV